MNDSGTIVADAARPLGRADNRGNKRRMVQSLTVSRPGPNRPTTGRWIPVPEVPVRPILSARTFTAKSASDQPCVLDQGVRLDVCAGRIAIACAFELMGLKRGDEVLIPAYHCNSMVDPTSIVGARPVFYRINPDLSANVEDIEARISPSTRALMVVHYFGFPQRIDALRELCDRHGLALLEDCAHSLFGRSNGIPLGSLGDYATTSLTKFLPVREGGSLVTSDPKARSFTLKAQKLTSAVREVYGALEDATYHNRLSLFRPVINGLEGTRSLFRSPKKEPPQSPNPSQVRSGAQGDLDLNWIHVRASPLTGLIAKLVSNDFVTSRRIANYRRLADGFCSLRGARVLVPDLPADTVPYMFPVWVDRLDEIFPKLEDLAVPMQRFGQFLWSGVDSSTCPVSASLSKHLVQFPCHQELTDDEIEWLIAQVNATVAAE